MLQRAAGLCLCARQLAGTSMLSELKILSRCVGKPCWAVGGCLEKKGSAGGRGHFGSPKPTGRSGSRRLEAAQSLPSAVPPSCAEAEQTQHLTGHPDSTLPADASSPPQNSVGQSELLQGCMGAPSCYVLRVQPLLHTPLGGWAAACTPAAFCPGALTLPSPTTAKSGIKLKRGLGARKMITYSLVYFPYTSRELHEEHL